MNKAQLYQLFNWEHVATHMLVDVHGMQVVFYRTGAIDAFPSNITLSSIPNILAVLKTNGHGNIDATWLTEEWCEYDEDMSYYVENDTGRVIGDLSAVIGEVIRDGDLSTLIDSWIDEIHAQINE